MLQPISVYVQQFENGVKCIIIRISGLPALNTIKNLYTYHACVMCMC